jgi:DNA-binding response OmpR family regulator
MKWAMSFRVNVSSRGFEELDMLNTFAPSTSPLAPAEILFVDASDNVAPYLGALRDKYRVTTAVTGESALQHLSRVKPSLVVTDLNVSEVSGVEVCRAAKSLDPIPAVLVTTDTVELVPDVLQAGCDGVLLKPFAPNLLYARIGRLLRARSEVLRMRAHRQWAKAVHLSERSALLQAGTNRVWPEMHCPYCDHEGATSFEFASHRRAWYACMACKKVWMAKRQE